MGGCATKPKVLKDDAGEASEPAPENAEELIVEEKKVDQEMKTEKEVTKEETDAETDEAHEAEEEKKRIEGEATESNPPQDTQLVVVEEKEVVKEIVEQVIMKEKINEEGKTSSQSEVAFDASEVAPHDEEKAKPETDPTATPTQVETEKEKPNVEQTLEKKPEEETGTQEEEKKREAAKPQQENNPFLSFITALMGQNKQKS